MMPKLNAKPIPRISVISQKSRRDGIIWLCELHYRIVERLFKFINEFGLWSICESRTQYSRVWARRGYVGEGNRY